MDKASIDLDLQAGALRFGGQCWPLASLERLWSVVAVFPGLPDETEQRWVIQTKQGIVLAPALALPSRHHVEALSTWAREHAGLFRLMRVGWPWRWSTLGWTWCAMRRKGGHFSLPVWDAVRRDVDECGPLRLDEVLRDG